MEPSIGAGDWLLVDPTVDHWPRRGSVVLFREPETGLLAIKRVVGRPGDWIQFADGWLSLPMTRRGCRATRPTRRWRRLATARPSTRGATGR